MKEDFDNTDFVNKDLVMMLRAMCLEADLLCSCVASAETAGFASAILQVVAEMA